MIKKYINKLLLNILSELIKSGDIKIKTDGCVYYNRVSVSISILDKVVYEYDGMLT